ncbi:hypothetical protein MMC22_003508 [Lobaria immixta]|nr:hypothetical protein [Lobaria immixta]
MLGNTPPLDLDGMYQMLEKYVQALNGDRSDLEKASKAVRKWNVQKFKEVRSNILSDGQRRIDRALLYMFDFDAKSEEDHQATTVTLEDAMATLRMIMNRKLNKNPGKIEEEHDEKLGDH